MFQRRLCLTCVLVFILVSFANATTINWGGIDWSYNEAVVNANVSGKNLMVSNDSLDKLGHFGLYAPNGIFKSSGPEDKYVEISFIDPYIGQSDTSRFYLRAAHAPVIDTSFGVFTSNINNYYLDPDNSNGFVWNQERVAGSHKMGILYSWNDNSIKYYFDGIEIYHRETTNFNVLFDIDSLGLVVNNTDVNNPFIFTDISISNSPPTVVPEPGSLFLFGSGFIALFCVWFFKKFKNV